MCRLGHLGQSMTFACRRADDFIGSIRDCSAADHTKKFLTAHWISELLREGKTASFINRPVFPG